MSKSVKNVIMREYTGKVAGAQDAMLIGIRGLKGIETTKLRAGLRKKSIKITVVRNSLARKTFADASFKALGDLLAGSSALAYGPSVVEVAREIVGLVKDFPAIELKGAVLDGHLYKGKAGVEELSKFPTRDEAIGQAVTLILSPARNLLAQVKGPGSNVAGIVKAIETKLEKGEKIG
jgi:large subunit ribosomal protein L10